MDRVVVRERDQADPARNREADILRLREVAEVRQDVPLEVEDSPPLRLDERPLDPRATGEPVVEASSGQAALRALDRTRFDLLLTDVVMPNMDGRELVELATAAHPNLKVLHMSGYTDDAVVQARRQSR